MEIATDFAQVVDGLEEVTLRRRDGMTSIAVIAARRQGVRSRVLWLMSRAAPGLVASLWNALSSRRQAFPAQCQIGEQSDPRR